MPIESLHQAGVLTGIGVMPTDEVKASAEAAVGNEAIPPIPAHIDRPKASAMPALTEPIVEADAEAVDTARTHLDRTAEGGNDTSVYAIAQLMVQAGVAGRTSARIARDSQYESEIADLGAAAQKIRDAAADAHTAAVVAAALDIVGGLLSAGGGVAGSIAFGKAPDTTTGQVASQFWSGIGQGAGTIAGSIGKIIAASWSESAQDREAEKTELQAASEKHKQLAESEKDMMQSYNDLIKQMMEKLSAIQSAENESVKHILRG